MDSYGVITVGDHLLSILGLVIYLSIIGLGVLLTGKLTYGQPRRLRITNYIIYGLCVIAIVSWTFKELGLDFYVKA